MIKAPNCPYCGKKSVITNGKALYPNRPDLADKPFYLCRPCDAYVGCHKDTLNPLGRLANQQLRNAKRSAHAAFDPMWLAKVEREQVSKRQARNAAYKWLATCLGISLADCHIGMFDVAQCEQVIAICKPFYKRGGV